jgi:hypothetical protein
VSLDILNKNGFQLLGKRYIPAWDIGPCQDLGSGLVSWECVVLNRKLEFRSHYCLLPCVTSSSSLISSILPHMKEGCIVGAAEPHGGSSKKQVKIPKDFFFFF